MVGSTLSLAMAYFCSHGVTCKPGSPGTPVAHENARKQDNKPGKLKLCKTLPETGLL